MPCANIALSPSAALEFHIQKLITKYYRIAAWDGISLGWLEPQETYEIAELEHKLNKLMPLADRLNFEENQ